MRSKISMYHLYCSLINVCDDNFISYILPRRIIEGDSITLFGDIHKRYNCIDVRDCTSAIISLLTANKVWNETYNVSNDSLISINEITDMYRTLHSK